VFLNYGDNLAMVVTHVNAAHTEEIGQTDLTEVAEQTAEGFVLPEEDTLDDTLEFVPIDVLDELNPGPGFNPNLRILAAEVDSEETELQWRADTSDDLSDLTSLEFDYSSDEPTSLDLLDDEQFLALAKQKKEELEEEGFRMLLRKFKRS